MTQEANQNQNAVTEVAPLRIGIDVGSTTVKLAVLDADDKVLYSVYQRHHSDVRATVTEVLEKAAEQFGDNETTIAITGSGGLLLAKWLGVPFIQEVIASKTAVETFIPETDVAIELGGEDAKIIYFDQSIEQRMNGQCAGGTGAFIDQMATLLNTDAGGLNELAKKHTTIYPIASRCGVFAKTDVQPLLNEGANKEDIAASIFQAVVTQTISGLACGRPICGHVAFLGGPLQYLSELRERFYITLGLDEEHIILPENAHLFVASGCAVAGAEAASVEAGRQRPDSKAAAERASLEAQRQRLDSENIASAETGQHSAAKTETLSSLVERLHNLGDIQGSEVTRLDPLFKDEADYQEFKQRHDRERVKRGGSCHLRRHGVFGHRCRLHHLQGGAYRRCGRNPLDALR